MISFPQDTKDTIDAIRNAIGRDITFLSEVKVPCTGCSIDPFTNASTNSFCPICSGIGYIVTFSGVEVNAHITWGPSENMQWVTGGTYTDGDCRVQIEYTADNFNLAKSASYVMVDERKTTVSKIMKRGVPTVNRLIIDLSEEEE